jgi:hypothetical protein
MRGRGGERGKEEEREREDQIHLEERVRVLDASRHAEAKVFHRRHKKIPFNTFRMNQILNILHNVMSLTFKIVKT